MSGTHPQEAAALAAASLRSNFSGPRYGTAPSGRRDTYATHRMRQALALQGRSAPGSTWARMSLPTRKLLVSIATDRRDADAAARMAWEAFTPEERRELRHLACTLRDELNAAGGLTL